ncbi:hypothetical protein B6I21_00850 [candidate division KSB1 bacterium 4572_119]|nr:MAG: hypothetical protein B6I21_00850 [candidate division KSB1 bacterium 4572_119]
MQKKSIISLDFFESIHEKDSYHEKITNPKLVAQKILNHFIVLVLFSFIYGAVMGCYNGFQQAISSGVKVPVLFVLIVLICFPALYVIQTILGSKLTLPQMLSVILSGFVMTTTIMVSFAPIVIFFLITGSSYAFIQLLHVGVFTVGGLFGMHSIIEALKFSCEKKNVYPKVGVQVFRIWIFILAFVGAQLSWSLRPFIGAKDLPFELFRKQEGNFYQAVLVSTVRMMGGKKSKPKTQEKQIVVKPNVTADSTAVEINDEKQEK